MAVHYDSQKELSVENYASVFHTIGEYIQLQRGNHNYSRFLQNLLHMNANVTTLGSHMNSLNSHALPPSHKYSGGLGSRALSTTRFAKTFVGIDLGPWLL